MLTEFAIVLIMSFVLFWAFTALWEREEERKAAAIIMKKLEMSEPVEPWQQTFNKESQNMKEWEEKVFGDE